jgi:hypothetical protein
VPITPRPRNDTGSARGDDRTPVPRQPLQQGDLWDGKSSSVRQGPSVGEASGVFNLIWLVLVTIRATGRQGSDLVGELWGAQTRLGAVAGHAASG